MVEVPPLGLHQREPSVGLTIRQVEVRNGAQQIILGRQEVRVEDREELCIGVPTSLLEGARLVAVTIDAAPHIAVHARHRPNSGADTFDERPGVFVG